MANDKQIEIVPGADVPAAPPYSNAAFVAIQRGAEVTILFLRGPVMLPQVLEAATKTGKATGVTVASVTLPPEAARNLGKFLVENIPPSGAGDKVGTVAKS